MQKPRLPLRLRPPRPRPPLPKESVKSSTGSTPWIPTTFGISPARPPAAWTWFRFTKKGEEGAAGVIAVSPASIQSMGVRTAKVEVQPLTHDTWTVGLVNFDERHLAVINTKVNGWVERLYVNATGDPVRRGQTLLNIYSPDLVSAQEEYLLALRNLKSLEKSPVKEMAEGARRLAEASRRRLEYFDVSAGQIETLKSTGQVKNIWSWPHR